MTDLIHAELVYIRKSALDHHQVQRIKGNLTVRSKFKDRIISVYTENEEYLGVPRYYKLPLYINSFESVTYIAEGTHVSFDFMGTLRPYQQKAVEDYKKKLAQGHTGVLLNAETGSGKSVMGVRFLGELKTTTLIIVPKSDLMDQWKDNLLKFSNIKEDEIGIAQQNICNYEGKKVVIGMLQSLCKDRYSEHFKQYFGCVLIDEIHRVSAKEFSKAATLFPAKYRIGLSASMERTDGTSIVFYLHLSNTFIKVNPTQPKPEVFIFNYGHLSGRIPKYCTTVQQRRGSLLSLLAKNRDRTYTLATLTARLAKSGRQTVVLAERKAMLYEMQEILTEQMGFFRRDVGVYIHETKKRDKARIAIDCTIILATSKMLSEGTDIASLRALVLATPVSTVLQPVGRIRRINDKYKNPIVLDFVDIKYKECNRWATTRQRWYKQEGFPLKIMK